MFTFRLVLEDGSPADPPTFVASRPDWREGDTLVIRPGVAYRIVRIEADLNGESGTWVVARV